MIRQRNLPVIGVVLAATCSQACAQWDHHAKLLATDGRAESSFGFRVSIDDHLALVGAFQADTTGAVYLFDARTGSQLRKLVAGDGRPFDEFGIGISLADGVAVVGADRALNDQGVETGAVYTFDAASGEQLSKIAPRHGQPELGFGHSVAIAGGLIAVGAHGDNSNGEVAGAAYLFDAATGKQLHKLIADDGEAFDLFGRAVGISEDGKVIVGAPRDDDMGHEAGAAYLFDAATGQQLHKLVPYKRSTLQNFGWEVAIDDGLAVVGALEWGGTGFASVFDANTGERAAILRPDDDELQSFGWSVAIHDGIAVIGAIFDRDDQDVESGSVSVFDASSGAFLGKLWAEDRERGDGFGASADIHGRVVLVGKPGDDNHGVTTGSACLFVRSCAPDLNDDNSVDSRDLVTFLDAWAGDDPLADWDQNGEIDESDFGAYLSDWIRGCD